MNENLIGKRVAVYRNLRDKCWSVQYRGLVVAHAHEIILDNCDFRVGPKGRERVLREQTKNVHARVYGTLVKLLPQRHYDSLVMPDHWEEVTYNPYKGPTFVTPLGPIFKAPQVIFVRTKAIVPSTKE